MRGFSSLLAGLALVLATSGASHAATLDFDGTIDLKVGSLPPFHSEEAGAGVATVNGAGGLGHLSTLAIGANNLGISPATLIPLTDPNTPEVATLIGTLGVQSATLAPISGGGPLTQNTLPVAGNFKLCLLFAGCNAWLDIQATQNGTKGAGIGGLITVNGFGAGVRLSVDGAPWTIGTAVFTGKFTTNAMVPPMLRATISSTISGFAHGPASASSTANIGGVVQFISPSTVSTTLMTPSNFLTLPLTMAVQFVPEPGLMLLLASGVAGLALIGRHHMRR